jgi:hypothetical protein
MAVLLVICNQRHGGDWIPWLRDGMYDDEGSLGDEIREWPEYERGLTVVRHMLERFDNAQD